LSTVWFGSGFSVYAIVAVGNTFGKVSEYRPQQINIVLFFDCLYGLEFEITAETGIAHDQSDIAASQNIQNL